MYDSYFMKKRKRTARGVKIRRFEERFYLRNESIKHKKIGSQTSDF